MSEHLKADRRGPDLRVPEPLTPKTLYKLLDGEPKEDVDAALAALRADYERPGGLQIVEVAGGYQIVTRPELHEWVRKLFHERTTQKLSVQALETLAVIAYKQPVTAPEIAEIRGVSSSGGVLDARRAAPDQDRRPQAGRRPSVHVCDDAGVPGPVRPERPHRPAEGRGDVGRARLRAAERAHRANRDDQPAAVRAEAPPEPAGPAAAATADGNPDETVH